MTIKITRRHAALSLSALGLPTVTLGQNAQPSSGELLTVELTGMALPVVQGELLINYLFCVIKIQMADGASTFYLREHSHVLRDAIVKFASKMPIPAGANRNSFDRVAVTRVVLRAVQTIRPTARVVLVTVLDPAFMRN
jgi:hypothetical protein